MRSSKALRCPALLVVCRSIALGVLVLPGNSAVFRSLPVASLCLKHAALRILEALTASIIPCLCSP